MDNFVVLLSLIAAMSMILLIRKVIMIIDHRKIHEHIQCIGGEVYHISRLSYRESIYAVEYTRNGQRIRKTVKFHFLWEDVWY